MFGVFPSVVFIHHAFPIMEPNCASVAHYIDGTLIVLSSLCNGAVMDPSSSPN